ncbi:hypothetical protein [Paenibacillus sp. PCH8]|nr:hypothetical protein [Paenibacillus sp. PCH8]
MKSDFVTAGTSITIEPVIYIVAAATATPDMSGTVRAKTKRIFAG